MVIVYKIGKSETSSQSLRTMWKVLQTGKDKFCVRSVMDMKFMDDALSSGGRP